MGEGHSIVVYVRDGSVERIAFCECCPSVIVEVRTYEKEDSPSPASGETAAPPLPVRSSDGCWRDHEGAYRAVLYEPDDESQTGEAMRT